MNKKILGLDISTTGTGLVLLDENKKVIKAMEFAPKGNIEDRIISIYKGVKKLHTTGLDYDIMAISKASYSQTNMSIMKLEGLILSLAIDYDKKTFYQPDSAWYSTLPSSKGGDERITKKTKSLQFMVDKVGFAIDRFDYSNSPKEVRIVLKNGAIITDNVSDAFCIAHQYEAIQEKKEIGWTKSNIQTDINKLVKENKKLGSKVVIRKQDWVINKAEKVRYDKLYEETGSKIALNSYKKRVEREEKLEDIIKKIRQMIVDNKLKIDKLRKEKNTL